MKMSYLCWQNILCLISKIKNSFNALFLFTAIIYLCFLCCFSFSYAQEESDASNNRSQNTQFIEEKYTPEDIRFAQAHMKIAVRAFKSNNISKAKEELELVLERVPTHSDARFLKAVICAREKDFIQAWKNIEIAQKHNPNNPKIQEFIKKLQSVYPKPANLDEISDIKRQPPQIFSQAILYSLEQFLSNNLVKSSFESLDSLNSQTDSTEIILKIAFNSEKIKEDQIKELINKNFSNENYKYDISELILKDSKYFATLKIHSPKLEMTNPKVQALQEPLANFVKSVADEVDLAIQESSENENISQNVILAQYSIITSDIKNIVDFIDKIFTNVENFKVESLTSSLFNNKNVLKGKLTISFHIRQ